MYVNNAKEVNEHEDDSNRPSLESEGNAAIEEGAMIAPDCIKVFFYVHLNIFK